MKIYRGVAISDRIVVGTIRIFHSKNSISGGTLEREWSGEVCPLDKKEKYTADPDAQMRHFAKARDLALEELEELRKRMTMQAGAYEAEIFEAQKMILLDETVSEEIRRLVHAGQTAAEAVIETANLLCGIMRPRAEMAEMPDRSADVRDVFERVVRILHRNEETLQEEMPDAEVLQKEAGPEGYVSMETGVNTSAEEDPVIMVAGDMTPSEIVSLDPKKVRGIVILSGSLTSHTTILANSMGMAGIVELMQKKAKTEDVTDDTYVCADYLSMWEWLTRLEGHRAVLDGQKDLLIVDPEPECYDRYVALTEKRAEDVQPSKGEPAVTRSGKRIGLLVNAENEDEVRRALSLGSDGVGLCRTEMIYLFRDDLPGEEEQYLRYSALAKQVQEHNDKVARENGERVHEAVLTLRAMDLAEDKMLLSLKRSRYADSMPREKGIGLLLQNPKLFRTQLRAFLRASVHGPVRIMYPMVTTAEEVTKASQLLMECAAELEREKIPYRIPKQGVMIETPEAAHGSDVLAKMADFFSIGTNDLTRYTLGVSRYAGGREGRDLTATDPRVLELIDLTIQNAHASGIPVGICGEAAADPELTEIWVRMGIDELSVSQVHLPKIKRQIRNCE